MLKNRSRIVCLLVGAVLLLGGCTTMVKERCSGSNHEMTCTMSYKKSTGQWGTELDGGQWHSHMVVSGTFSVESGSGTLILGGADETMEYPISADEPVEIADLTLTLHETSNGNDEPWVSLTTKADDALEGFSAEVSYVTM